MVGIGTELKINIGIEPIDGYTMDDYDFNAEFFVYRNKTVSVSKNDMVRVDENNYIALLDSNDVGSGRLMVVVTAYIPDSDFQDGLRTEVSRGDTGIIIIK